MTLSAAELQAMVALPVDEQRPAMQLSCVVKNTGHVRAAHVVIATAARSCNQQPHSANAAPSSVDQSAASLIDSHDGVPIKSVVGFERVFLTPGQSRTVQFNVTAETFVRYTDTHSEDEAGGVTPVTPLVEPSQWDFEFLPSGQDEARADAEASMDSSGSAALRVTVTQ
jgi:hypothetical protein